MSNDAARLIKHALQARRENRLQDAKRDLVEAVEICRRFESRDELARALTGIGQIERDLDHSAAALEYYEEAIAIYRSQKNLLRLAHTVRHVGDIHCNEQHYELAAPCYEEALDIYRACEETSPLDLANALRGFAILLEAIGERERGRALWQEAKELYAAMNVEAGIAESTRHLERLMTQKDSLS